MHGACPNVELSPETSPVAAGLVNTQHQATAQVVSDDQLQGLDQDALLVGSTWPKQSRASTIVIALSSTVAVDVLGDAVPLALLRVYQMGGGTKAVCASELNLPASCIGRMQREVANVPSLTCHFAA